jgi:hypothetical protein
MVVSRRGINEASTYCCHADTETAMRHDLGVAILISLLLASAAISQADWEYTTWGMSVDEVRQASQGRASDDDPTKHDIRVASRSLLQAPYEAYGWHFTARLLFSTRTQRLDEVSLEAQGWCDGVRLARAVQQTYGPPASTTTYGTIRVTSWEDPSNNTRLELLNIASTCYLNVTSLRPP